jgi:hypothetical protein
MFVVHADGVDQLREVIPQFDNVGISPATGIQERPGSDAGIHPRWPALHPEPGIGEP